MIVPTDTFVHSQRDAIINLTVQRIDGRALPAWLHFNPLRGEFYGTSPQDFDEDMEVKIVAHDGLSNEASTTFRFRIHKEKQAFKGKPGLSSMMRSHTKSVAKSSAQHHGSR